MATELEKLKAKFQNTLKKHNDLAGELEASFEALPKREEAAESYRDKFLQKEASKSSVGIAKQ